MQIFEKVFSEKVHLNQNLALKSAHISMTYEQLEQSIVGFANHLYLCGIRKNDKVLILLNNSVEFVTSFFGVTLLGGTAILADTKYSGELITIFKDNYVKCVITDSEGAQKSLDTWKQLYPFENLNIINMDASGLFKSFCCNNAGMEKWLNTIDCDDLPALILYTSGSSGVPKGVINTHSTLQEALRNYSETVQIGPEDKLIAVTPFFHSYSFGSCMLAGLGNRATLLIAESFQPRRILNLITREKATIFQGVPYMYKLMSEHFNENMHCLDSLRLCISAGAPLSPEVAAEFYNKTGKIIHQEYGSSETGTIAVNLSDSFESNIKSVGPSLKNVNIRIEEIENNMGVIQVKSLGHSLGYVNQMPFERGWYTTGDLGILDDSNYIYIMGRLNKMINVSGLKVNPTEVENCIIQHPEVKDVMVRGATHSDFGEVVEALVVRRSDNINEDELIRYCQKNIALYKVPRIIKWVECISKSSLGKTRHDNQGES